MPIVTQPPQQIPQSVLRAGFVSPEQARRPNTKTFRRLLIATEGKSDTGKTEFLLSAPGPGVAVVLDRGFDAVFDNPNPPSTRRTDFGFKVVQAPVATQAVKAIYLDHWRAFYKEVYKACEIPEVRTVCIDGDSDSWELQRLAEHGQLTGIFPQTRYTDVYAARRGFYYKLWDYGKIIIATNKVKDEYRNVVGADGQPVVDPNTKEPRRERTGGFVAQGFPDQEYLWQIRVRHLYQAPMWNKLLKRSTTPQWGLRILKAKAAPAAVGTELWGGDCTFQGLVETVYPHIDPKEWGL